MRALACGAVLIALSIGGPVAAASAAPAGSATQLSPNVVCTTKGVASLTRSAVVARGASWVTAKVPYSQTACRTDANGTYRTDCSGFVSMAWGLKASMVTSTLPSVATAIAKSALQPGDMLDQTSTHAVLFVGWYDTAHTRVNVYQESNSRTGTIASTGVLLTSYATYGAYRYNHVTAG